MTARQELLTGGTEPAGRWTSIAQWREQDGSLVGVFDSPDESYSLAVLPYGIEKLGNRELRLVLPAEAAAASRHRAAFISADVQLLIEAGAGLEPVDTASQSEALGWYGGLGPVTDVSDVDEFDGPAWLVDLIDWLESRRVERIRRSQYWSWHYRGRQVLRVAASKGMYRIIAGVAYSKPRHNQPRPVTVEVGADGEPTAQEMVDLKYALDLAIERRRVGIDRDHREHLLQEALSLEPSLLGMADLFREFASWRPALGGGGGRGFIDFLGVDVDGNLHVVETKIGPDPMLGIQGLDYWAWVTANRGEIYERLGRDPTEKPVELHYVVATSDKTLIHPAAAQTMRRLAPEVPWRCHVITDWNTVDNPRQLLRPRAVPGIRPSTIPDPAWIEGRET